jgi:lysozyme
MTLRTTTDGLAMIKVFEGMRLRAYRCPAGVWTIGYGHTSAAGPPQVTPGLVLADEAAAAAVFRDDIDRFEDRVETIIGDMQVDECQFDALVSFAFNCGLGSLQSSSLLRLSKAGQFDRVPAEFLKWDKATVNGVKQSLPGLSRRRHAEAALWIDDRATGDAIAGLPMLHDMPQQIDPPVPPKTMAQSTIGNTSIAVGTAATAPAAVEIIKQVNENAASATDAVSATSSLMHTVLAAGPWLVVALLVIGGCVYIWRERRRLLQAQGA